MVWYEARFDFVLKRTSTALRTQLRIHFKNREKPKRINLENNLETFCKILNKIFEKLQSLNRLWKTVSSNSMSNHTTPKRTGKHLKLEQEVKTNWRID